MPKVSPLMEILAEGASISHFSAEELSLMYSEARRAGILARLCALRFSTPVADAHIPESLRNQSLSASIHASAFRRDVMRELDFIKQALARLDVPVILLKGAAYVFLNNSAAEGRIFNDIDILVSKQCVGAAEGALMLNGWLGGKLDSYDQRYYREWSHEIPPMTHRTRGTTIDLHHSLVMPTCRIKIDTEKMIRDAIPMENSEFWWRLKDEDLLLHAASHLMLNSDFERGLRDLWDIDLLFRQFLSRRPDFSDALLERADDVGLGTIARDALGLAARFFGTPVSEQIKLSRPSAYVRLVQDSTYSRHAETRSCWQPLSDVLLSLREMYLRLPNPLLIRHLLHKGMNGLGLESNKTKPI